MYTMVKEVKLDSKAAPARYMVGKKSVEGDAGCLHATTSPLRKALPSTTLLH